MCLFVWVRFWAIEQVLPLLDHPDRRARRAAIAALPKLSVPRLQEPVITKLLELLPQSDPNEAHAIANTLAALAAGTAHYEIHRPLAQAWLNHGRASHRILSAIGAVGHPSARALLEKELQRPTPDVRHSAIVGLMRLGDARAIPALEQVFSAPASPRTLQTAQEGIDRIRQRWHYLFAAQAAVDRGDYRAAQASATAYINTNPEDSSGFLIRACASHLVADLEAARDDYARVTELSPDRSGGWRGLALVSHALNDLEQARQFYDRALDLARADGTLRFCRALLNLQTGSLESARRDFRLMLTIAPPHPSGEVYRRMAGSLERATAHLESSSGLLPVDDLVRKLARPLPDMLDDMGLCWLYSALGEMEQAILCARRLINAWPDMRLHGQVLLWWLQVASARVEEARETFQALQTDLANRGWRLEDFVQFGLRDWPLEFPVILPSATAALAALMRQPEVQATV